jgi:hypothetical protein
MEGDVLEHVGGKVVLLPDPVWTDREAEAQRRRLGERRQLDLPAGGATVSRM